MMSNTMLLNINRNMRYVDKLYTQIASTKKIQRPSEDPIIASRALKFRTNVAETEQYQRNVQSGLGWMNVTEAAFVNLIETLLDNIRYRCVEAATGTETGEDKRAVVTEIKEMIAQIGIEMNQTYAGRYVFSGYRTNQPPVFNADSNAHYDIAQYVTQTDIEKAKSYQKIIKTENGVPVPEVTTDKPIVHDIYILKIPYKDVTGLAVDGYDVVYSSIDDLYAYDPPVGGPPGGNIIHYIPETGELVMHRETAEAFPFDPVKITYEKHGFLKGELNPLVYFEVTDLDTGIYYDMNNQNFEYEFSVNTNVTVNALAKNVFTDQMYADLLRLCEFAESITLSDPKQLEQKYMAEGLNGDDLTNAINKQLADERALMQAVLYDRFNNMLYLIDRHAENAMRERTQLASRMRRLEMMQERLEQDEVSYTKLLSDNEDTDMAKTYMLHAMAEAAYNASLKAGANIIQLTLANFI